MTVDEARTLLGVATGATHDEVRRAYLRLVKKHKPETDPEGFQRARSAFETLEPITPRALRSAIEVLAVAPVAPVSAAVDSEPAPSVPPAALPTPPLRVVDRAWRRELGAKLQAEDEPEARCEILEAALVERPDDAWLWTQRYAAQHEIGDADASLAVVRRALARGVASLEPALFVHHAGSLSPEELDSLRRSSRSEAPRWLAIALALRGEREEAVAIGQREIRATGARIVPWVELVAALYETDALVAGSAMLLAIEESIESRGEGARLPNADKVSLREASELAAVAPLLPRDVRAPIALALRIRDSADALERLAEYARQKPIGGIEAAGKLEAHAPALSGRFGPALRGSSTRVRHEPPSPSRGASGLGGFGWILALVATVLMRVAGSGCHGHTGRPTPSTTIVHPRDHRATSRRSAAPICPATTRGCGLARSVSDALDRGDCDRADERLRELDAYVLGADDDTEWLDARSHELRTLRSYVCASSTEGAAPAAPTEVEP